MISGGGGGGKLWTTYLCPTLSSKNCNQASSNHCGGIWVHSSLLSCFNSTTLGSDLSLDLQYATPSLHFILWAIQRSWIKYFTVQVWWLEILILGRKENLWFYWWWQIKQQSSPRLSHYHHNVWLLVWHSCYEMLCYFTIDVMGLKTSKKVQLLSSQNVLLAEAWEVLVRWGFVFFLVNSGFHLGTWNIFAQSLSCGGFMNTGLNWGK